MAEIDERNSEVLTLQDYVRVVRRRWLTIVAITAALVGLAVLWTARTETRYEASADVLLVRQNSLQTLTGTPDPGAYSQPERFMTTEAQVASVPAIARRVLDVAGVRDLSPDQLIRASTVKPLPESDLLRFQVTDRDAGRAATLANAYAQQYQLYRRELQTAAVERAQASLNARIQALERAKQDETPLYVTLVDRREQLRTMEEALAGSAFVIRRATTGSQVQPKPVRNVGLALAIGLILGMILAFARDALDTRVRSPEEVRTRLGLPLLARIPPPSRGHASSLAIVQPFTAGAEAFRMLRTHVELANLERNAKVIMVTSAREKEGKSLTTANLAIALSRAGRRVILVDLDLRRPTLNKYLGVDAHDRPGVMDVVTGAARADAALIPISIADETDEHAGAHNGRIGAHGRLDFLPAGGAPADPGEFVSSQAVARLLADLRDRADYVLLDTPAILPFGDATALGANADAVIAVVRLKVARRPVLAELRRSLDNVLAIKLGVVVTGVELEDEFAPASYRQLKDRHIGARGGAASAKLGKQT